MGGGTWLKTYSLLFISHFWPYGLELEKRLARKPDRRADQYGML